MQCFYHNHFISWWHQELPFESLEKCSLAAYYVWIFNLIMFLFMLYILFPLVKESNSFQVNFNQICVFCEKWNVWLYLPLHCEVNKFLVWTICISMMSIMLMRLCPWLNSSMGFLELKFVILKLSFVWDTW